MTHSPDPSRPPYPPMPPEQRRYYRRANRIMARYEWNSWWPLILIGAIAAMVLIFAAWNAIT